MREKRGMLSGSTSLKNDIEAIAIGAFDGIHPGHKELFKRLGPKGGVVVIEKGDAKLTPGEKRCEYVDKPCFFYPLEKIRHLDALGFLTLLKRDFPHLKKIVVGYDFAFGKGRKYRAQDLKKYFDGDVEIVEEVKIDGISVHSRLIKELIKKGEIEKANRFLGRIYSIEGKVVKGQGIGKKELVPTINMEVKGYLLPKEGVYVTLTKLDHQLYPSITFLGKRVSTDGKFSIETHIIDAEPKRSEKATIFFLRRLRENRKFTNLQQLKDAIMDDIQKAKEILEKEGYL